ncbi:hypothetical protein QLS71_003055 [Mariniflexile litorale]|uniref:Uncharacterized protein n=1 Tax=Mariniflexile litorale TaxID=3045158 RepID=A0AAU7EIQ1_9FLAO|nr:hypothetical protein [Mariniflexile sp. KMM 9835]MDQ8209998.1 hypothetical protein [Mariniflexile sp. KMM 9835]
MSGQEEKEITMVKKLINKDVKIPSTAIKEIQGEMKKKISFLDLYIIGRLTIWANNSPQKRHAYSTK